MTTKRSKAEREAIAENKALTGKLGGRVIIMITDNDEYGTPLIDDYVYPDQELRVREFVETLGPLPRQPKRIVRLEHTDFEA